jgi:AGZA family xanthine/uracil permease-like MFS transporter
MSGFTDSVDRFFRISERGSNFSTEIRGGIVTFLAMLYILAVNPLILSSATGPELFQQLVTATAFAAFISCILMGLYARFPVALAPGMGINAFVAYTIVITMGFSYPQALMAVLLSGILFFVLTVSGVRKKILTSIPLVMRASISAGIGFFIVVIGLYNSGIIVHASGSALDLGDLSSAGVSLSLLCILFTLVLWYMKKWYAVLLGAILTIVIGFAGGQLFGWDTVVEGASLIPGVGTAAVGDIVAMPDFGLFGQVFDGFDMFDRSMIIPFAVSTLALLIVDVFDTTGTLLAIGHSAGIVDQEGNIEGSEKALGVDAVASVVGAVAGTSTTTSFVESTTGISMGAKTGLMAIVVGILFGFSMFFAPALAIVTSACTVGALFVVGLMMIVNMKQIQWDDPVNVATAFLTIFMMGLSGSITDGIAFGFIAYVIGMIVTKKSKSLSLMTWILAATFLAFFVLMYVVIPRI